MTTGICCCQGLLKPRTSTGWSFQHEPSIAISCLGHPILSHAEVDSLGCFNSWGKLRSSLQVILSPAMDLWSAGVCALEAVVLSSPLHDRYLKLQGQPLGGVGAEKDGYGYGGITKLRQLLTSQPMTSPHVPWMPTMYLWHYFFTCPKQMRTQALWGS